MNSSTVTFPTSTNSTTQSFGVANIMNLCVYSIHFLFGLPTHSYILWHTIRGTGSGVASEFFNLNLSVCEIVYALASLLFVVVSVPWLARFSILTWFLFGLFITGRPLFQCLICVERYLAVVHPVTFLKFKPLRYRVICCSATWIITLGSCLVCFFTTGVLYIHVCFYTLQFLLFLSIQLFCLVAVLRALKQSGPGERDRKRKREDENHVKRRAFYLILIITVSMIMTYVPYIISGFSFIVTQRYSVGLFSAAFVCFILVSFVQPVLYFHRTGKLPCPVFSPKH